MISRRARSRAIRCTRWAQNVVVDLKVLRDEGEMFRTDM